jgi:hypothetical protein
MAGKTHTGTRLTAPMVGTAAAIDIPDWTAVISGGGSCRVWIEAPHCTALQASQYREISEVMNCE